MADPTTTLPMQPPAHRFWQQRTAFDWTFAVLVLAGGVALWWRLHGVMDGYDQAIFIAFVPALIALGWWWRALARLAVVVGVFALAAIALYRGDVQRAEQAFWLKYLL
ncbi:MAG: c-type cytochrome biogenesis protein CcsB, partial [Brachymonas sp.]|nr:c-type cytochrome biogenesis protein CcsB [Brachymonas sp.]